MVLISKSSEVLCQTNNENTELEHDVLSQSVTGSDRQLNVPVDSDPIPIFEPPLQATPHINYTILMERYARVAGMRYAEIRGKISPVPMTSIRCKSSLLRLAGTVVSAHVPQHAHTHVAHLDAKMCDLLIGASKVYDHVRMSQGIPASDVKAVHSGDMVGHFRTSVFSTLGYSQSEIDRGISVSITSIGDFNLGARTMLLLPTDDLAGEFATDVEIAMGGLRLRSLPGYSHFGMSFPSEYLSKVVFHVSKTALLFCRFQTGRINKTFGKMERFQRQFFNGPSVRFSHPLGSNVDQFLTPRKAPLYTISWNPGSQSVLQLIGVKFFHLGHVVILLNRQDSFNILVPSTTSATSARMAIVSFAWLPDKQAEYAFTAEIARARAAEVLAEREVSSLNVGYRSRDSDYYTFKHCPETIRVLSCNGDTLFSSDATEAGSYTEFDITSDITLPQNRGIAGAVTC